MACRQKKGNIITKRSERRPLRALRDGGRFHAFHDDERTSETRRVRRSRDFFISLLSITAKSPDNCYRSAFDEFEGTQRGGTEEPAGVRRIDRASHRQIPRRNKSRSGRSTARYPRNPPYSNKSHESAIMEPLRRLPLPVRQGLIEFSCFGRQSLLNYSESERSQKTYAGNSILRQTQNTKTIPRDIVYIHKFDIKII